MRIRFSHNTRREKGLLATASVLLVAGAGWLLWPRPSLAKVAERLARAALADDADTIARALPEPELAVNGMTRLQAKEIVASLVTPRLKRCRVSSEKGTFFPDKVRAAHLIDIRIPSGRILPMAVVAEKGDGDGVSTLGEWLKNAWYVEYFTSHPEAELNAALAYAYGYDLDKEFLRKHGFKGFYRADGTPGGGILPIEEAYRVWISAAKAPGSTKDH